MKKILSIIISIVLVMMSFVGTYAEPAPHLTDLQIIGVTSSGNESGWENITPVQGSATQPMTGDIGYLQIKVIGTGINMQIYNNATNITSITSEAMPTTYITDTLGTIIGYVYYKQFPLNSVSSGDFSVQLWDYSYGTSISDSLTVDVVNTPPSIPTNLMVLPLSDSEISVTWDAVPSASGYTVEVTPQGGQPDTYDGGNSPGVYDEFLHPNKLNSYRVKAYNAVGSSNYTDTVSRYTYARKPANGFIELATTDSITASWGANNNPSETQYALAAFDSNGNVVVQNPWTSNLQDTISGLQNTTLYEIKVKAKNSEDVETSWYTIGNATTLTPGVPEIPTNLSANVKSSTQIDTTWDMMNYANGYQINVEPQNGQTVTQDIGNNNKYEFENLTPNTSYSFAVQAYNEAGNSSFSSTVSAVTYSNVPSNGAFGVVNSGSITASWQSNGNPANTYYSLAVFDVNDILVYQNAWTTNLTDTLSNLSSSTTYKVKVKAKNTNNITTDWLDLGSTTTPAAPKTGLIGAGYWHTVVIKNDGNAGWAWGANASGQLGDGTSTQRNTPVSISGISSISQVQAGHEHNLVLKTDGTVMAWGYNYNGQIGDGTTTNRSTPVNVSGLNDVTSICTYNSTNFALKSDGTVWAWGNNLNGEIADGTTTKKLTPVKINSLSSVIQITCGYRNGYALKSDGTVWAWGDNYYGQIGDGTNTNRLTPVKVSGLIDVKSIVSGFGHVFAIKNDGTVWGWGYNKDGQLGNGSTTNRSTPTQITALTNVKQIYAGDYHTLMIKNDGTVWSWGDNYYGQLGDGTTTDRYSPVKITTLGNIIDISTHGNHNVALKSDGTIWTWGWNSNGQIGDGTSTNKKLPYLVSGISFN